MKQAPFLAPNFSLQNQDDETVRLVDFAGKWLVVYFYPKDDTPGCTAQACSIRDNRDEIVALGADVVGISKDGINEHDKFKAKYSLNFNLLSDPNGKVIEAYEAWGKKMFGREGILRKTFIIDPHGTVQKVYGRAIPAGHGEQIVADLRKLQASK